MKLHPHHESKVVGLVVVVVLGLGLVACPGDDDDDSSSSQAESDGGGQSHTSGNASHSSGATAAAQGASKIKNPCDVMPVELVRKSIPDARDPVQGPEPFLCGMTNDTSVVQIWIQGGFGEPDPLDPADAVDLGEKAWLQEQLIDDTYILVFLGVDDNGSYRTLTVEYAGNDKKNHRDEAIAIAIAKAVIAKLES